MAQTMAKKRRYEETPSIEAKKEATWRVQKMLKHKPLGFDF
jgi:hypothetical protein